MSKSTRLFHQSYNFGKMTVVQLTQAASVKGVIQHSTETPRTVHCFKGIPYAEPPVGNLRFKPPQPFKLWNGQRDCTKFGAICPQNIAPARYFYHPYKVPTDMDEDCLFLNIYSPAIQSKAKLPVMVWIHGGAFVHGFSDFYDSTSLCTFNDVVVVTLNYRVGALGFLATGDGVVSGNMGLLDQVEALRWVQKYISKFGGDPNNVTLFGESAGGISISYHILSPQTKGLFHRAILQSGVAVHPGATWPPRNARKYLLKRLKNMGCTATDGNGILEFLSHKSADEVVESLGEGFSPVCDGDYLPDFPEKLYQQGRFNKDIDVIMGFNENEGAVFVFGITVLSGQIDTMEKALGTLDKIIDVQFFRGVPNAKHIKEAVIKEYLKDAKDEVGYMKGLIELYGDLLFVAPTIMCVQEHAKQAKGRTYLYHFTHKPPFFRHPPWVKADHGQEILFVFGEAFLGRFNINWPVNESELSKNIMSMWCNFAKTGDPNGSTIHDWPTYSVEKGEHMVINPDLNVKKTHHQPERVKLWNQVVPSLMAKTVSKY